MTREQMPGGPLFGFFSLHIFPQMMQGRVRRRFFVDLAESFAKMRFFAKIGHFFREKGILDNRHVFSLNV